MNELIAYKNKRLSRDVFAIAMEMICAQSEAVRRNREQEESGCLSKATDSFICQLGG